MKLVKCLLAGLVMLSSSMALSMESEFVKREMAVGIGVGTNDGISMSYEYAPGNAMQGFLSIGKGFTHTKLDFLSLHPEAFKSEVVVPYIGVGGLYANTEKEGMDKEQSGVRIPMGVQVNLPSTPFQLAVELAPTLEINPETDSYMETMLAVRSMF